MGATEWSDMGEGALSDMASPNDLEVAGEGNRGGGAGPADGGAYGGPGGRPPRASWREGSYCR